MDKQVVVSASETHRLSFEAAYPSSIGSYAFVAQLLDKQGKQITRSIRKFNVVDAKELLAKQGIAQGKPVKASSTQRPIFGRTHEADNICDGSTATCWCSEREGAEQWIAVDLEEDYEVRAVEILWGRAHAKIFSIEVSLDGENWSDVYSTDSGRRETQTIEFAPTKGRWVRLFAREPGRKNSRYTIYEFKVFGKPVLP